MRPRLSQCSFNRAVSSGRNRRGLCDAKTALLPFPGARFCHRFAARCWEKTLAHVVFLCASEFIDTLWVSRRSMSHVIAITQNEVDCSSKDS